LESAGYLGPARIVRVSPEGDRVLLRHEGLPGGPDAWATLALAGGSQIRPGARVLALGNGDDLYVIGVLDAGRTPGSRKLDLPDGTYAEATGRAGEEKLRVMGRGEDLLFEYDPRGGKVRVGLGARDVEIAAAGSVEFVAGKEIRLSGRSVGITGGSAVTLGIQDALGHGWSSVSLGPRRLGLEGPTVAIDARRGDLRIDEARYTGKRLMATVDVAKLTLTRLETAARTVIGKARDVYRTVERLVQTKAGRMRTLVASTIHVKSKKTFLKSEEDFKVKADEIHLG
jgi:hypothetical protein